MSRGLRVMSIKSYGLWSKSYGNTSYGSRFKGYVIKSYRL